MVDPYTPQDFFDQPANITNGQLLVMQPKFALNIAKLLKKPVTQKKVNQANIDKTAENKEELAQELIQVNTAKLNNNKATALYCEAFINHIQFPLIIDSGSARCIMSLFLLRDLDMKITEASKL